MKKRLQGLVAGFLIAAFLTTGSVIAKQTTETAELVYNDIKITIDGQEITPKDSNGNVVEPFIIDGTTYLPVRAIANAFGKNVNWDATTNTVVLYGQISENNIQKNRTAKECLQLISDSYNNMTAFLRAKLDETYASVGNSYFEYISNRGNISEWYKQVESESNNTYTLIDKLAIDYFKAVASTIDRNDSFAIDNAMNAFYNYVIDDVYESIFTDVYDTYYAELKTKYYDGIIDAAYGVSANHKDWSAVRDDFYNSWSKSRSSFYDKWADAQGDLYRDWLMVKTDFLSGNFDVDAILAR